MAKYRKKSMVIEAFQMTLERHYSSKEWPEWLKIGVQKLGKASVIPAWTGDRYFLRVSILEGNYAVELNDWIIQNEKGELLLCEADVFEATYEAVEEDHEQA